MKPEEIHQRIQEGRKILKYDILDLDFETDQQAKKPQPPLCKERMSDEAVSLPRDFEKLVTKDFTSILLERKSHRVFTEQNISLLELSYLLYMTQGVKEIIGQNYATLRPVACGGARHEFETYLIVNHVEGLKQGRYHYLPFTHELEYLGEVEDVKETIDVSLERQTWATKSSVVFYWSMIPYRCEWRYSFEAHRPALMDAGHIGQNLYLACTALGLGTCCLAAFDRLYCNQCFYLDDEEEFVVYCAPVGTIE